MSPPTRAATRGQVSRRSRITTPMRGFGAKDVDFRGIRTPRAAVAITAATVGGCTATTIPGWRAVVCSAWSRLWW